MLWSSTAIEGRATLVMLDASRNLAGWEAELGFRLFTAFKRRGQALAGEAPLRVDHPDELGPHLSELEAANCVLLLTHGGETEPPSSAELHTYWGWLNAHVAGPKLFAACSWGSYDPLLSQTILTAPESFAPLAAAAQSPVTQREGGLYFLKFFTELDLHSEDRITGKMVWFSASKAKELLRRRRLQAEFGVRC